MITVIWSFQGLLTFEAGLTISEVKGQGVTREELFDPREEEEME